MTIGDITRLVCRAELSASEQLHEARKLRCQLLEELHTKQQLLDQLDYLIYKIKQEEHA